MFGGRYGRHCNRSLHHCGPRPQRIMFKAILSVTGSCVIVGACRRQPIARLHEKAAPVFGTPERAVVGDWVGAVRECHAISICVRVCQKVIVCNGRSCPERQGTLFSHNMLGGDRLCFDEYRKACCGLCRVCDFRHCVALVGCVLLVKIVQIFVGYKLNPATIKIQI